MNTGKRQALTARLQHEFTSPHSGLTYVIRTMHESDWLRLYNEVYLAGAQSGPTPRTKSRRSKSRHSASAANIRLMLHRMRSIHQKACEDAERDIRALGFPATALTIHAYQYRIGAWTPIVDLGDMDLEALVAGATARAAPSLRDYLPRDPMRGRDSESLTPSLTESQLRAWSSAVRDLVRSVIIRIRAEGLRGNYVLLKSSKTLPSRDLFFGCSVHLCQDLIKEIGTADSNHNDMLLGTSAAEASAWHLRTLEWQLQEVDMVLNPRESFLSLRSQPKQLGIWRELALRMAKCLPSSTTRYAKAKAIAAAMLTYVGAPIFASTSVDQFAKDTIQKWLSAPGN